MRLFGTCTLPLVALLLALSPTGVWAGTTTTSTYVVNTTEDVVDPDDTLEGSLTPKVSLREAIRSANTNAGVDTIEFDAAVFDTTAVSGDSATGRQTITLTGGELDLISDSVTITGPAVNGVVIDANDLSRIFTIGSSAAVTMQDLLLINGNGQGSVDSGNGGAIYNQGTLVLLQSTVAGNSASNNIEGAGFGGGGIFNTGSLRLGDSADSTMASNVTNNNADGTFGSGGGILNHGGVVEMYNGSLSGNRAARAGGGLEHTGGGTVSLTGVAMDSNQANGFSGGSPANPGNGGGIHSGGAGQIILANSSAVSNSAANEGGAIWAAASSGATMQVQASTLSANSAAAGGGIFFDKGGDTATSCPGQLVVEHATLANNSATTADSGGGIFTELFCVPDIDNSILGNNNANSVANDIDGEAGASVTIDNSIVEASGTAITLNGTGNIEGTDPNLAALSTDATSGTRFHRLNAAKIDDPNTTGTDESSASSVAIDAIANGSCIGTDQRLLARNFDFNGTASDDCDIGAIELNSDVFAVLDNFTVANDEAASKNGKLVTVTAGQQNVQAIAFNLQSKAIDETQTAPGSTIRVKGFSGTVIIGENGFVPALAGIKLWLDTDNNGILDTGTDTDITSGVTLTLDETARTFNAQFNNNDQDIAPNSQRGYIVSVNIPGTPVSAGLFGLPVLALALLQRRKRLRIGLFGLGLITMLSACSSGDREDPATPEANTTVVQTFRIRINAIDAVESVRNEVITVSPNSAVNGLLLHLTAPK